MWNLAGRALNNPAKLPWESPSTHRRLIDTGLVPGLMNWRFLPLVLLSPNTFLGIVSFRSVCPGKVTSVPSTVYGEMTDSLRVAVIMVKYV